jgi:hypothetical protein
MSLAAWRIPSRLERSHDSLSACINRSSSASALTFPLAASISLSISAFSSSVVSWVNLCITKRYGMSSKTKKMQQLLVSYHG